MKAPLVREGASAPCYPAASRLAFRLALALRGRCFLPTSATDYRHEHPLDRSILELDGARPSSTEPARIAWPKPSCSCELGARPPCGDSAPSRRAFDDAHPTSNRSLTASALGRGDGRATPRCGVPPCRGVFNHEQDRRNDSLTLPVAPRSRRARRPNLNVAPEPLLPPSRQRERLSRPKASSVSECPAIAFAITAPATVLAA